MKGEVLKGKGGSVTVLFFILVRIIISIRVIISSAFVRHKRAAKQNKKNKK